MSLAGCFVTPHPPIIVPEVGGSSLREVADTVTAMRRLAVEAEELAPETIVILSPHAPLDPQKMGVIAADRFVGSLGQFGAPDVQVEFTGDAALADAIEEEGGARDVPLGVRRVAGVAPLDHGAVVPLYYVASLLAQPLGLVELSFSFQNREAHLRFGQAVGAAIDQHRSRVLYVASGDLSHRLTPGAPAGYNPQGAEFDRQVVEAFASGDTQALLDISAGLQESAGECGYRSFVVLAGLLAGRDHRTRVLAYEGPFGVGYLVAVVDVADPGPPQEHGLP